MKKNRFLLVSLAAFVALISTTLAAGVQTDLTTLVSVFTVSGLVGVMAEDYGRKGRLPGPGAKGRCDVRAAEGWTGGVPQACRG